MDIEQGYDRLHNCLVGYLVDYWTFSFNRINDYIHQKCMMEPGLLIVMVRHVLLSLMIWSK